MIPKKIKIIFTLLALGAVLSVFSFTDYFHQSKASLFNLKSLTGDLSFKVETDTDHDGLSDIDESYWGTDFQNPDTDGDGFLDGEEVASGHDPTKPGPDDLLANQNLTEKLSDLAAAGLVEGSLKPGSPNYDKSMNDLTLSILDDSMYSLSPEIDTAKIIVVNSSRASQELYAKEIQNILQKLFKTIGDQIDNLKSNSANIFVENDPNAKPDNSFLLASDGLKKLYDQAVLIHVPDNWKDNHIALLKTIGQLAETNKALAYRARDPVKGAAAFSLWAVTYDGIADLMKSYADQMIKEGLINDLNK